MDRIQEGGSGAGRYRRGATPPVSIREGATLPVSIQEGAYRRGLQYPSCIDTGGGYSTLPVSIPPPVSIQEEAALFIAV